MTKSAADIAEDMRAVGADRAGWRICWRVSSRRASSCDSGSAEAWKQVLAAGSFEAPAEHPTR